MHNHEDLRTDILTFFGVSLITSKEHKCTTSYLIVKTICSDHLNKSLDLEALSFYFASSFSHILHILYLLFRLNRKMTQRNNG